jgi:hypothetical protein
MDGLNKSNCAYALDGTCRLDAFNCPNCKVDKATSDFHKSLASGFAWYKMKSNNAIYASNKQT